MLNYQSIFNSLSSPKIVQKAEETTFIKKNQILKTGVLGLIRNSKPQATKTCSMLLTRSRLYYVRGVLEEDNNEVCVKSRARIDLSWLRTSFYTNEDVKTGTQTYCIEITNQHKSVVFNCIDHNDYAEWKDKLSYLTVQTDFRMRYKIISELDKGASARVYKISDVESDRMFACKRFVKDKVLADRELENLVREITMLRLLRGHPNIVDLLEVQETQNSVYVVMELLEGTKVTERGETHSVEDVVLIARAVLSAISYMNEHSIVHRDLKPSNILTKYQDTPLRKNTIKIIDFGIAAFYNHKDEVYINCGTVGYVAPEYIAHRKDIKLSPISDMFTLGVILYNAFTGERLFTQFNDDASFRANRKAEVNFNHQIIRKIPADSKLISSSTPQRSANR